MDAKILEQIKAKLLTQKKDLEGQLAKYEDTKTGEVPFEDIGTSEDENAQEVAQFSDQLSLVAELNKHLEDVNKALKKIQEGTYGICKYCKKEIDPKRLLIRPDSGSCVDCKAALQGEKA